MFDRFGGASVRYRPCNHAWRPARAGYVTCFLAALFSPALLLIQLLFWHPETKFHVKPLPHARIPIVKLSLDPSPALPLGIACDIGFENRLALENTRLLYCYAMIDPTRVRTLVLFRKSGTVYSRHVVDVLVSPTSQSVVQTKVPLALVYALELSSAYLPPHRKINSPYKGTLSSYGYVLLVIYFLVHVKHPPVLPNLQHMPPMRPISHVRLTSSLLCATR